MRQGTLVTCREGITRSCCHSRRCYYSRMCCRSRKCCRECIAIPEKSNTFSSGNTFSVSNKRTLADPIRCNYRLKRHRQRPIIVYPLCPPCITTATQHQIRADEYLVNEGIRVPTPSSPIRCTTSNYVQSYSKPSHHKTYT